MPLFFLYSCHQESSTNTSQQIDIQGHRGCRGLFPENSIPGFMYAVELGVHTLEMDVVISKDSMVVVSHEPFMSNIICMDSTGEEVTPNQAMFYNIYDMSYTEVKSFDCGSRFHASFPNQKKVSTYKPLLSEVIDSVEKYIHSHNLPKVSYNIETKSTPQGDELYHPNPNRFADMVLEVIMEKGIEDRAIIQSFDVRTLQEVRQQAPQIQTALLVYNQWTVEQNIAELGFTPDIYSPHYDLIDSASVQLVKEMNMKLIPWTINDSIVMKKWIHYGVDGIITDYPNLALSLLQ